MITLSRKFRRLLAKDTATREGLPFKQVWQERYCHRTHLRLTKPSLMDKIKSALKGEL